MSHGVIWVQVDFSVVTIGLFSNLLLLFIVLIGDSYVFGYGRFMHE